MISVGINGVISTNFVRAINLVLNGVPEVSVEAYELILKYVTEVRCTADKFSRERQVICADMHVGFCVWVHAGFQELQKHSWC